MGRFDRYVLSQVMVLFGFFSLVLILIYWINQAVRLFDQLISDGQSAWVFLEFTALTLPGVIKIVLPLSTFVAALYVTNRMTAESELIVVQSAGYSAWRLARPVAYFGLFVSFLMMILLHFLVPNSSAAFDVRQKQLSQNMIGSLLSDGQFMTPIAGVTLYIGELTNAGELLSIFLSDDRNPSQTRMFTAERAYVVKTDNGPQIVMIDGLAQFLFVKDQNLVVTAFKEFAFDLGEPVETPRRVNRRISQVPSLTLLRNSLTSSDESEEDKALMWLEVNKRNSEALLPLLGALLGFSALMVGGFSRFGAWRQIVIAIFLVILIKGVETSAFNAARQDPQNWGLVYLDLFFGLSIVMGLLFWSSKPTLFRRKQSSLGQTPTVTGGAT